jgi:hypothetical protein
MPEGEERSSPGTDDDVCDASSVKSSIDENDGFEDEEEEDKDDVHLQHWDECEAESESEGNESEESFEFSNCPNKESAEEIGQLYFCPADEHPVKSSWFADPSFVESGQFSDAD